MNPKKPKDFIKPTAEDLGIDESIVDDVVNHFWSAVRKALTDLEEPSITVANIGSFRVRYKKIQDVKDRYQRYITGLEKEKMTYTKHTLKNQYLEAIAKLDALKEDLYEQFIKRNELRENRKNNVTNKDLEGKG